MAKRAFSIVLVIINSDFGSLVFDFSAWSGIATINNAANGSKNNFFMSNLAC
jgi:hypothetical protein